MIDYFASGAGDCWSPDEIGNTDSCGGCGKDDCEECARFKPCSRGHDRDDGLPCCAWVECGCGAEICSQLAAGKVCPTCGEEYRDEPTDA